MELTMIESIKELAPLGVGGILGGIIFLYSRADMLRLLKESEGRTDALISIVKESVNASKEHTIAISILTEVVRSNSHDTFHKT